eukprot:6197091-Pleurochrysis_carterae.AAC.6
MRVGALCVACALVQAGGAICAVHELGSPGLARRPLSVMLCALCSLCLFYFRFLIYRRSIDVWKCLENVQKLVEHGVLLVCRRHIHDTYYGTICMHVFISNEDDREC